MQEHLGRGGTFFVPILIQGMGIAFLGVRSAKLSRTELGQPAEGRQNIFAKGLQNIADSVVQDVAENEANGVDGTGKG